MTTNTERKTTSFRLDKETRTKLQQLKNINHQSYDMIVMQAVKMFHNHITNKIPDDKISDVNLINLFHSYQKALLQIDELKTEFADFKSSTKKSESELTTQFKSYVKSKLSDSFIVVDVPMMGQKTFYLKTEKR